MIVSNMLATSSEYSLYNIWYHSISAIANRSQSANLSVISEISNDNSMDFDHWDQQHCTLYRKIHYQPIHYPKYTVYDHMAVWSTLCWLQQQHIAFVSANTHPIHTHTHKLRLIVVIRKSYNYTHHRPLSKRRALTRSIKAKSTIVRRPRIDH